MTEELWIMLGLTQQVSQDHNPVWITSSGPGTDQGAILRNWNGDCRLQWNHLEETPLLGKVKSHISQDTADYLS